MATCLDPAKYLPIELFIGILKYCRYPCIEQCQSVSTLWQDIIFDSSELWSDLDYFDLHVTADAVLEDVNKAKHNLLSLVLPDLDSEEQSECESTVLTQEWPKLNHLQLTSQITCPILGLKCLSRLSSLSIHIRDASQFVENVLLTNTMPNLTSLSFRADWFEIFKDTIQINVPSLNTASVINLRRLHIGSPDPEAKYLYRYLTSPLYNSNKWILLWMTGMQRLLYVLPNLEEFSMIRIDAFAISASGFQHSAELDLTHLKCLKRVTIKYSMVPQILLNNSCEFLDFMCSTETPRFVTVAPDGTLNDSNRQNGPSLKSLTLADVAYPFLGNFALLRIMHSLNTTNIVHLDLSSVCYHRRLIDYSSSIFADIDAVSGSNFVPENRFTLVDNIVSLCPHLKSLVLGNTITDESLALFRSLDELEHVEVLYSPEVTRNGILALLRLPIKPVIDGEFITTEQLLEGEVLTSPIKKLIIRDCRNIYTGLLDHLKTAGVDVQVESTSTFTINGDISNLDLLTHYRWHVHGYDRIRDLPQQRSRPEVVHSIWRGDVHWI
ncbi:hypothetical protein V1512DRAFT_24620 [Lipomyces arxii]|uniref:uncharacterized protein n=1 Tax=Lipomyces arxii TaxID=56418 RepID=UPI0034CE4CCE